MAAEDKGTGDRENADPNLCSTADASLSHENTEGDFPSPVPSITYPNFRVRSIRCSIRGPDASLSLAWWVSLIPVGDLVDRVLVYEPVRGSDLLRVPCAGLRAVSGVCGVCGLWVWI